MVKTYQDTLWGMTALGLSFSWVMYLLFHGPGLAVFPFDPVTLAHLGLFAHVGGLLHSAWQHNQASPSARALRRLDGGALFAVVLLTLHLACAKYASVTAGLIALFAVVGYASSRLIVRWGAWFCSPVPASARGTVLGSALVVAYTIVFLLTTFLPPGPAGAEIGLLICACAALMGGIIILQLPVPVGRRTKVRISAIVPPRLLVLFSVVAFCLGTLPYSVVFGVHLEYPPFLAPLAWVTYVIPVLFSWWSDRTSRHVLAIAAFVLLGTGFAVWTVTPHVPLSILAVQMLILSGNLCAAVFLWTYVADNETTVTIPLRFAAGLSLQVTVHSLTFAVQPHLDRSIIASQPFMGALGTVLVLAGLGMVALWGNHPLRPVGRAAAPSSQPSDGLDYDFGLPVIFSREYLSSERLREVKSRFSLTDRELEAITLVITGHNNREISERMFVSISTTKFHIRNILRKMDVSNRQAVREEVIRHISG